MGDATGRSTLAAALALAASLAAAAPLTEPLPAGIDTMRALAKALLADGRYEASVDAYRTIAEHAPHDAESQYQLAAALAFLRRYPEAVAPIERARALAPESVLYHELAAITFQQLRRVQDAFRATLRGAELGDIKAMYTLAGMYEHGRGTGRSARQALRWLERAADNGHLGAMEAMTRVYRDGLYGEPRDAQRAAAWAARLVDAETR